MSAKRDFSVRFTDKGSEGEVLHYGKQTNVNTDLSEDKE